MQYRTFPKTGIEVSEVSIGAEHILANGKKECIDAIHAAMDVGMNYMDLFMPQEEVRDAIGEALLGRRERMLVAGHLGATLKDGQYKRTRALEPSAHYVEDLMRRLHTDYLDMLMMHYIDEMDDAKTCLDPDSFLKLALSYKESGKARMLGFSSHDIEVSSYLIDSGVFDAVMFSVNPLFDLMPEQLTLDNMKDAQQVQTLWENRQTVDDKRMAFYRKCETEQVGIVVMKGYAAGTLFKQGWTPTQCLSYALSRPGVVTVAAGYRTVQEVEAATAYLSATPEERDYAQLLSAPSWQGGQCMYCNHCLPCPAELDIAQITRLLDRFEEGDASAKEAYRQLEKRADLCIACQSCVTQCPFHIDAPGNMKRAQALLGK